MTSENDFLNRCQVKLSISISVSKFICQIRQMPAYDMPSSSKTMKKPMPRTYNISVIWRTLHLYDKLFSNFVFDVQYKTFCPEVKPAENH